MRQIRAIREVPSGKIITVNEVSDAYGDEQGKQKLLDGMVDGIRYVYDGEEIGITASQAPKYMDDKLKELIDRESKVEAREGEIHTRFKELAHKEVDYETRLDELKKREAALVEKEGAKTQNKAKTKK